MIVWLSGTLISCGQITLSDEQFKFYAEICNNYEVLLNDTSLLNYKIRVNKIKADSIDKVRVGQIRDLQLAKGKDSLIGINQTINYQNCSEERHSLKNKNKNLIAVIFGLGTAAIIEGCRIYITTIKK